MACLLTYAPEPPQYWLKLISSTGQIKSASCQAHNLTSHTDHTDIAAGIASDILTRFYTAFTAMADTFTALSAQADPDA